MQVEFQYDKRQFIAKYSDRKLSVYTKQGDLLFTQQMDFDGQFDHRMYAELQTEVYFTNKETEDRMRAFVEEHGGEEKWQILL